MCASSANERNTANARPHASPVAGYVRARDLPKLVPLWPSEINATDLGEHARLLAKLRRALRAERQRGISGHWTYDLARHAQLLHAYRAEAAAYLHATATRAEEEKTRRSRRVALRMSCRQAPK
jgi:hypothetical protein